MHKILLKFSFILLAMASVPLSAEEFSSQYHIDWLPSYRWQKNNVSFLKENQSFLSSDLRGDLKLSYSDSQLVLRPRFLINANSKDLNERDSSLFLSEAYFSQQLTNETQVTVGRQSYQWGPAELVSWSNTLFHFVYDARSFFYKEDGKYLLRGGYSPNKNTSWILMAEAVNEHMKTDYDEFIFNQKYERKALLKVETIFDTASNYLGFTLSTGENNSKNAGFYGNYELMEGLSIYTDSRVTTGATYYELIKSSNFNTWRLNEESSGKVRPLMLMGVRYEGKVDLRFEYIYNSLGLNSNQLKDAISASGPLNPFALYNSAILARSGREFLGQQYFYTSLRVPNLGAKEDLSLYLRHFYSFQDHSSTLAFLAEKNLLSSLVGYVETEKSLGKSNTELTLLTSFTGRVGVKWTY